MDRVGYLRVQVVSSKDEQPEVPVMTSIQVSIPRDVSFKVAKLIAQEKIAAELERYGLQEALSHLGLKPVAN